MLRLFFHILLSSLLILQPCLASAPSFLALVHHRLAIKKQSDHSPLATSELSPRIIENFALKGFSLTYSIISKAIYAFALHLRDLNLNNSLKFFSRYVLSPLAVISRLIGIKFSSHSLLFLSLVLSACGDDTTHATKFMESNADAGVSDSTNNEATDTDGNADTGHDGGDL